MMGKSKKNKDFLSQIEKAQKERSERESEEKAIQEASESNLSADEEFQRIFALSKPFNRLGEFYEFENNLPKKMHPKDREELVSKVADYLQVDSARLELAANPHPSDQLHGMQNPLLDSLSCKLGVSLRHVLTPPVVDCLLCNKPLTRNNKPTHAALHTLSGKHSLLHLVIWLFSISNRIRCLQALRSARNTALSVVPALG